MDSAVKTKLGVHLRWHSNLLNGVERARDKYQEFISGFDNVRVILTKNCFAGIGGGKMYPL